MPKRPSYIPEPAKLLYMPDIEYEQGNDKKKVNELINEISNLEVNLLREMMESLGYDWTGTNPKNIEEYKPGSENVKQNIDYRNYSMLLENEGGEYTNIDVDDTITLIGLAAIQTAGGDWINAVIQMGSWYQNNIHTYWGKAEGESAQAAESSPAYKDCGKRRLYLCNLFPDEVYVADDCTGFVSACVLLLAYKTDQTVYDRFKSAVSSYGGWGSSGFGENGEASDTLKSLGFVFKAPDQALLKQGEYEQAGVVQGDIICCPEGADGKHHHGEIFWGKVDSVEKGGSSVSSFGHGLNLASMAWGSCHDNLGSHYGMPSETSLIGYNQVWHYTRVTGKLFGDGSFGSWGVNDMMSLGSMELGDLGPVSEEFMARLEQYKADHSWHDLPSNLINRARTLIQVWNREGFSTGAAIAAIANSIYECGFKYDVINMDEFRGKGTDNTGRWQCGEGLVHFTHWNLKERIIKGFNSNPNHHQTLPETWSEYNQGEPNSDGKGTRQEDKDAGHFHICDLDDEDAALLGCYYYINSKSLLANATIYQAMCVLYKGKAGGGFFKGLEEQSPGVPTVDACAHVSTTKYKGDHFTKSILTVQSIVSKLA